MQAHQYKVRQQKMIEEQSNPYWLDLDLSLRNATIKPVSKSLATSIIEEYEWLKCMPAFSRYYFGIFFKSIDGTRDECGGVVVFSDEYSANTKNWDKYGFKNKLLLLSRGVCKHWCPINTNSKLIMAAIKMLPKKYEIITCTTDPDAGEIGTIYQACNFHYVGVMRKKANRFAVKIDGKIYGSRTIRNKIGTIKKEEVLKHFPNAEIFMQKSKSRYFYFTKNKKKHLNAIKHLLKPYPKR